jgi:hypothetical protein
VSSTAIILCVASQPVFIVVIEFGIDAVRKLLDTPSYTQDQVINSAVRSGNEIARFSREVYEDDDYVSVIIRHWRRVCSEV